MSMRDGTPLLSVPGWSRTHTEGLAKSWITTAEQVVGVAATPAGLDSLARQAGVSDTKMQGLIEAARKALPPAVAASLSQPVDASQYGLGALATGVDGETGPRRAGFVEK